MNRRMVFRMVGRIIELEAVMLLLPLTVALIYGEWNIARAFLITALIAGAGGILMTVTFPPRDNVIFAKEGFMIVALAWLLLSAIGALPFVISKEIPSFCDAFFETVSGFTTTGASILNNVELLSHGNLFWRSFTHWIGGMGVLVLIMAIIPPESGRSIHILRAEMPGPIVGKLVPRIRQTAKILYLIYIALTAAEVIMLLCGEMSLFESLVHSFGTAGTGGFGIKSDSIGGYSPYLQWVIAVFMLIFGVNFNLYYLILIGKVKSTLKSEELWSYIGIVTVSSALIIINIRPLFDTAAEAVRHGVFQVSSIITTTGYSTVNFDTWPGLSRNILLLLMFVGGCAGSTAGGLKVSRVVLLFKMIKLNLKKLLHPRTVGTLKFEGKTIDESTLNGIGIYFALYAGITAIVFLILSFEPFSMETNLSAAVSCFNNVGPGFASVGPACSYAGYSAFSKIVLSFVMLFGRLEIYPLLLILFPSTWFKK